MVTYIESLFKKNYLYINSNAPVKPTYIIDIQGNLIPGYRKLKEKTVHRNLDKNLRKLAEQTFSGTLIFNESCLQNNLLNLSGLFKDMSSVSEAELIYFSPPNEDARFDFSHMFENCENLTYVQLDEITLQHVKEDDCMFCMNNKISKIDMGNLKVDAAALEKLCGTSNISNFEASFLDDYRIRTKSYKNKVIAVSECKIGYELKNGKCKMIKEDLSFKSTFLVFLVLFVLAFISAAGLAYFLWMKKSEGYLSQKFEKIANIESKSQRNVRDAA